MLGFERGISCQSIGNNKKNSSKTTQKDPLGHQVSQNKEGVGFIPHVSVKPIPKGDAVATEENHVLGFPLTLYTQRVDSITSKATILDEALRLAKSRSEEGSKKHEDLTLKSQGQWVVLLQEHPLTQEHSLEKYGLK